MARTALRTTLALCLGLLCTTAVFGREWVDVTGKHKTIAEFVAVRGEKVILEKPDGSVISVPIASLSKADRDHIDTLTKPAPAPKKGETAKSASGSKEEPPASSNPAGSTDSTVNVATTADQVTLAENAEKVLRTACYRCHGEDGSSEGGFNFVVNMEKLARTMAKGGASTESLLLKRMKATDDGVMPPVGEEPRPSAEDIAAVKSWIDAGSPVKPKSEVRQFIKSDQIVDWINTDIKKVRDRNRRFMRYFTLTHLYNAGVPEDELQTYRNAFTKLVNSLSWNTSMVIPRPIDPGRTVMAVDIRDLHWQSENWKALEEANPYFLNLGTPAFRECREEAQTDMPYVRIDWFVFAASKPPLYHVLLNLPETDADLEDLLRVNVAANIEQEKAVRAAFNRSGVSQNNRLIEWHKSPYGSYWKSYDFGGSAGNKNLFQYPLGPNGAKENFKHDGGEIIFTLPNGLQGYLLVDDGGKRIEQGPTSIVSDPKRPDKTVTNGVSCMSCHYTGVIPKKDEVGIAVRANRKAFDEAEDILALYREPAEMDGIFQEDSRRFAKALREIGINSLSRSGEPISAMASLFEQEIDLAQVACEFGISVDDFKDRLDRTKTVARTFSALLVPGGTIKRDVFKTSFVDACAEMRLVSDDGDRPRIASNPKTSSSRDDDDDDDMDEKPSRPRPSSKVAMPKGDKAEIARFPKLKWGVKSVAFSPNGKFLAVGMSDRALHIFDVANQSEITSEQKLNALSQVSVCAYSPNGKWLIVGGYSGPLLVYSVESDGTIEKTGQFSGHTREIECICISNDSQYALTASDDKTVKYWEIKSGDEIASFGGFEGKVKAAFMSKTGKQLYGTDGETLIEYDLGKKAVKRKRTLNNSWASGQAAAFAPNGDLIAVGDHGGVRVWDLSSGKELPQLADRETAWAMAFSPDGSRLVTSGSSGSLSIWDPRKAKRLHVQMTGESGSIRTIAVAPDGKSYAAPCGILGGELVIYKMVK